MWYLLVGASCGRAAYRWSQDNKSKNNNRNFGKLLVGEVETEMRTAGQSKLTLTCDNDNANAHKFYKATGFQVTETCEGGLQSIWEKRRFV